MSQTLQAQTQNDDKEARLKVAKAERGDTGKYTIKVANAHGEDSADINVVVLGQFLIVVMLSQLIKKKFNYYLSVVCVLCYTFFFALLTFVL